MYGIKKASSVYMKIYMLAVLAFILSGCVILHEKHDFPIAEVPPAGELSATITVLRVKQFIGSYPTNYVMIDEMTVAKLETGQYTKFSVSEGIHSFKVFWESPGVTVILPYGGFSDRDFGDSAELSVDCRADENYYLVIKHEASMFEGRTTTLFKVDTLDGDLALDNKTFVPPGPSENDDE